MIYDCSSPCCKHFLCTACAVFFPLVHVYLLPETSLNIFQFCNFCLSTSLTLNVFITFGVGNQPFIKHWHHFQDSWSCDLVPKLTSLQKIRLHFKCFQTFEKCLLLLHRPRKQLSFPRLSLSSVGGGFGPHISESSIWPLGVSLIPMERMGWAKAEKRGSMENWKAFCTA